MMNRSRGAVIVRVCRRLKAGLALAAVALISVGMSGPATAGSVTLTYNGGFYGGDASYPNGYVNLTALSKTYGTPTVSGGGAAGADNISVTGALNESNLQAYCVDVAHYLNSAPDGNYSVMSDGGVHYFDSIYQSNNGQAIINRLDLLASNTIGQGLVNNSLSSAALQIAIWDIVFSNDGSNNNNYLNGGTGPTQGFSATTGTSADALAASFLHDTSHPIDMTLTVLENSPTDSQSLITFAPVPLPAALPLMFSGLGLLGGFARRRRVG